MIVRIKDAKTGKFRVIGTVEGGVFLKSVNSQRHKFRKTNAYGIQSSVVDKFTDLGVKKVRIVEEDTGDIYESLRADWTNADTINLGFGQQRMLPLNHMKQAGYYDSNRQLVRF